MQLAENSDLLHGYERLRLFRKNICPLGIFLVTIRQVLTNVPLLHNKKNNNNNKNEQQKKGPHSRGSGPSLGRKRH